MAGVRPERIEFDLGPDSCVATLYLGGKAVLEVTAQCVGRPWITGTEGIFAATVLAAHAMEQGAEELGIPLGTQGLPEAKA